MEKQKVKHVIKEKVQDILTLCKQVNGVFDKDTIHDFRVAVKSLRSFLRMMGLQKDMPRLRISKKFKRLYHISGAMRDASLEIEHLTAMEAQLPCYIDKRRKFLAKQNKEWEKHYSKKTLSSLKDRLSGIGDDTIDPALPPKFFASKLGSVHELCSIEAPSDDQVHSIRKHLKDILYNLKTIKKKTASIKNINKLTDVIGDYNDKRISLQKMSSISSATMEQAEKKAIKALCLEMAGALKADKEKIMDMTRDLVGKMPQFR